MILETFNEFSAWLGFACLITACETFDLGEWLRDVPFPNGGTAKEQIQCYALPYGGIGFISHLLTYATVICLSNGRSPLTPWRTLSHRRLNIGLAMLGVSVSFPVAILTMVRCRNAQKYAIIAVWKLALSLTLTAITIHSARLIEAARQNNEPRGKGFMHFRSIYWWTVLYFVPVILGMNGTLDVVQD